MAENLYNSEHKATNKSYRDNYDRIFVRHPKELWPGSEERAIKWMIDELKSIQPNQKGFQ